MTNKKGLFFSCMIGLCLIMTSCSSGNDALSGGGTGSITLSVKAEAGFTADTRAVNENGYKDVSLYTVQILNSSNGIETEFIYGEKPGSIKLNNGSYTLKAFYGKDSDASRNDFYVEGVKNFAIDGAEEALTVECVPVCGKVVVNFANEMSTYFSDYSVVYETAALTAAGSNAVWNKGDTEPWYLKVNKDGETIKGTIHVTRLSDGKSTTVERTYKLAPNKSWTLNVAPKDENGSIGIAITIDESTIDHVIDIVVPSDWI